MSVTHGEQTARSVALEQAYVHEVYEQCAEKTAQTRHWPSIYKFLEELEPGALVCDIGCGDGKYLNANKNIFNVGGDRCKRLTDIAREKENEVLVCDNLSLPFRDESFDAVLSIAVIHHFATTERRVNALKELARVLRIGGKLVISVWAMEQDHRKFESQDVLVPWPKAYCLNSTCNGATSGMPCMKRIRDNNSSQKGCILRSKQSNRGKNRNKNYWNDPIYSSSPSTSSLSSPNETCYSFFRRALQKLAGGKRNSSNRPWFLDSFHSVNGGGGGVTGGRSDDKNNRYDNCDQYECGDIDDIPIELRRLEDEIVTLNKQTDTFSIKSKSLTDILEIQRSSLVRSRSSIPGLCSTLASNLNVNDKLLTGYQPRLVKQKNNLIDDTCLEVPEDTAIRELIKDLPEFQTNAHQSLSAKRANVQKQSSMNEEFMSMERLAERESVRKNIMKQASLSEDIICKRRTFENLKDSLSSGNATRRFQLLKNGLTKRLQQSSMSMDKVSGISLKTGFVKILQGWKSSDSEPEYLDPENINVSELIKNNINERTVQMFDKKDCDTIERRLSREDGSDSSKDSSLQSDTSVDSEDSFASVIYVPKQEIPPLIDVPSGYQLRTTSAPPSPRIKHPPDLHGPRLKLISISPLLKQFPATSKSLPPPSPPGLSPRTINLYNSRPFFGPNYHINQHLTYTFDKLPSKPEASSLNSENLETEEKPVCLVNSQKSLDVENVQEEIKEEIIVKQEIEIKSVVKDVDLTKDLNSTRKKPNLAICRGYKSMSTTVDQEDLPSTEDSVPLLSANEAPERFISESSNDDSRKSRLNQIKELLKQKPGFATRSTRSTRYSKSSFPLVRRASTTSSGRLETTTRTLPRLLSLELFNPETDDLDSDSSGVSSPESVGSVISVISDERFLLNRIAMTTTKPENPSTSEISKTKELSTVSSSVKNNIDDKIKSETTTTTTTTSQSLRLLEAAASVASSLEDAVSRVIRVRSKSQDSHELNETINNNDIIKSLKKSKVDNVKNYLKEKDKIKTEEKKWNDECHKHLIDFTEKLSENLINDIDKYCKEKKLEFNSDNDLLMSKKDEEKNLSSHKRDCKYTQLVDNTIAWLKSSTGDNDFSEYDNKLIPLENQLGIDQVIKEDEISLCHSSNFDDSIASKSLNVVDNVKIVGTQVEKDDDDGKDSKSCLRFGGSVESSDIGDSTETTVSISDDSTNTRRFCSGSTVSLGSSNIGYKSLKEKRKNMYAKKSASEDTKNKRYGRMTSSNISGSSSQESLSSDRGGSGSGGVGGGGGGGGGAITYHQYYHVFREGELDQLINKYVENLHIISSYYDHASWCIVAEKVQVWTI